MEWVHPKFLKPAPYNPRKHPQKALEKLKKSIQGFGFTNPILAQKGTNLVIAGHARLKAALEIGLEKVPVIYLEFEDKKAKAYNLADNRLQEETEWDFCPLADLLLDLDQAGVDLDFTGFDPEEIEKMMTWTPDPEKPKREKKSITCPECGHNF